MHHPEKNSNKKIGWSTKFTEEKKKEEEKEKEKEKEKVPDTQISTNDNKEKKYVVREKFDPTPMAVSCFFGVNCYQVLVSPKDIKWIGEQKLKTERNKRSHANKRTKKARKKQIFLSAIESLSTNECSNLKFPTAGTAYEYRGGVTNIFADYMKKKSIYNRTISISLIIKNLLKLYRKL